MKKAVLLVIVLLFALSFSNTMSVNTGALAQETQKDNMLKFDAEGKFEILIISDYQETDTPYSESVALIKKSLDTFNPDLVVLLGDNTGGWWKNVNERKTHDSLKFLVEPIAEKNIPFALVFGNHDHEGGVTRERLMELYNLYPNCLAKDEGPSVSGVGNYNLTVKDKSGTNDLFNLYFMDSNDYAEEGGYGYVKQDQIDWYENLSDRLKNKNGGRAMPSLLFQHIAVPEVYDMLSVVPKSTKNAVRGNDAYNGNYYVINPLYVDQGALREGPCPPNENHGQFESWVRKGDVLGAFFGHDHVNDFSGVYKGIRLSHSVAAGFCNYGDTHGVRTVTLFENDIDNFKTETHYFEDIMNREPANALIAKYGTYSYYKHILPLIICVPVAGIIIAGAVVLILKLKKNKKRKADKQ